MTDNRKQRKRTTRDLQQGNTEQLPVSNSMNAFSPSEKFVAEDQQNTNVTLSAKIDHAKNNNPIKNNANNTMLLSEVVFSNVTDQRIENNFSCDPTENACNVLKEVTFCEEQKSEYYDEKDNNKGIDNLLLSQGDSSLADILASFLNDEHKFPTLSPNANITSSSTSNNISTQGSDTSISLNQCVDQSENEVSPPVTSQRLKGFLFRHLSKKVLHEIEIQVLEKGLGFVPTTNSINEEDLRRDFGEFSRKMRCKWYFRDEPSPDFSEIPAFQPKDVHLDILV